MLYSYVDLIQKVYPDFVVHVCESSEGGQFNDVLIVNREYVFRFPRYTTWAKLLACETGLLKSLQGMLPLDIPNPQFQYLEEGIPGKVFMGYPIIPGENLLPHKLAAFSGRPAWKAMAAQLGIFLQTLHSIDAAVLCAELPSHDGRDYWENMYLEIQELLFGDMRPDARHTVRQTFENYLDTPRLQRFEPCLRHGDFGPSNILYDSEQLVINGVIDFSEAALGDAAVDLAAISCYGEDFLQEVLRHYRIREGMLERAAFYRSTFALQEALAGAKFHDRAAYEAGMAKYI